MFLLREVNMIIACTYVRSSPKTYSSSKSIVCFCNRVSLTELEKVLVSNRIKVFSVWIAVV